MENHTKSELDRIGEGIIAGRNPVLEALRAGRQLDKVYIAKGDTDASLRRIAGLARDAGAVVVETDRRKLDAMSDTNAHQGVVALGAVRRYADVEALLAVSQEKGEPPFLLIGDEIADPHNLGAMIRTAEAAGAHGLIIPKRRSAGVTAVVEKTSAGAASHFPVARVPNLTAAIEKLKKAGVWICGTVPVGGIALWEAELTGPLAIVIGSEGGGMSRLVSEHCDFHIQIPMYGQVSSLNASVSAAVLLYEALRQRKGQGGKARG